MGHAVLNLDDNVSVTENFMPVSALDELAQYAAHDWNPFHFESEGAARRVWRNLVNRDLPAKWRRLAKAAYEQASSVQAEDEDQAPSERRGAY